MNYSEAVDFIQSFPDAERGTHSSRGATMSLDSMKSLLKRMNQPQNGRRTIHVTGSKGKGSTCLMLASILKKAGYKTALYTSPHLHSYTERIALDLEPISEELFAKAVTEIQPYIEAESQAGSGPLSTFGILTALFFHIAATSEPPVDVQIVEVGLGGRYDATNVFDRKEMAIVTAISLEHVEVLGATQTEIATNKGAIITPGCIAVLAPQKDGGARAAIGRQCHQVGGELVDCGSRPFKIKTTAQNLDGQSFSLESPIANLDLKISLLGTHQVQNAATAAIAAKALNNKGLFISDEQIKSGLADAIVAGRFEILNNVIPAKNGTNTVVILDGAHNHESAAALAHTVKTHFPDKKCIFVLGVNSDKNINAIWRELSGISSKVIATRSQNLRAMDPDSVADAVSYQSAREAATTGSVKEALDLAASAAGENDLICVTGSLYVVAEARALLLKHA